MEPTKSTASMPHCCGIARVSTCRVRRQRDIADWLPGSSLTLAYNDGSLAALNPDNFLMPQGRKITQYQFVDDFSWIHGRHNFRVGANYRRDDITDQNFVLVTPEVVPLSLAAFASGGAGGPGSIIAQNFPTKVEEPIALYQLGVYVRRHSGDEQSEADAELATGAYIQSDLPDQLLPAFCRAVWHNGRSGSGESGNFGQPAHSISVGDFSSAATEDRICLVAVRGVRPTVIRGGAGIFADALPTARSIASWRKRRLIRNLFPEARCRFHRQKPETCSAASQASNATFRSNYANGAQVVLWRARIRRLAYRRFPSSIRLQ